MPVAKVSQRLADDLLGSEPPGRDCFYWSDRMPGFGLKHRAGSGSVSWVLQWRDRKTGSSHRLALGDASKVRFDAAKKAAETNAGRIAPGENPLAASRKRQRQAVSFGTFILDSYLLSDVWRRKAPSTKVADEARIKAYLLPALGDRKLFEITPNDLKRLGRDLADPAKANALALKAGRTKATVRGGEGGARRTMRLLKAILAFAVEEGELEDNPGAGLKLGTDGEREGVPDDDAYRRLWAVVEELRGTSYTMQRACDCIALIALTGARKAEVQHLRWRHVDVERRRLVLGRDEHKAGRKTGKTRVMALPNEALAILGGYTPGEPDGFVFAGLRPDAPVALQRPWDRVAEAAALPPAITLHSLRHGVGALLAAAGMTAPQISMALGHSQWRTSERYVHAVDRARDELAERTAELVRPRGVGAVK